MWTVFLRMNDKTSLNEKEVLLKGKKITIVHFTCGKEIFEESKKIAEKKADNTMTMSVSGSSRDRDKIVSHHIQGKIADKAFKKYLEQKGFDVEEYDEIRTDDFKKPDPWDLRIVTFDCPCEVRSSCISKPAHDLNMVLNYYRILGPYTITGYKESEGEKYLHVQVMFLKTALDLKDEIQKGNAIEGYIVCFIDRKTLFKIGSDWSYGVAKYKVLKIWEAKNLKLIKDFF